MVVRQDTKNRKQVEEHNYTKTSMKHQDAETEQTKKEMPVSSNGGKDMRQLK